MLGEPENKFSLNRAALRTSGCGKSEFLSVTLGMEFGQSRAIPMAQETL